VTRPHPLAGKFRSVSWHPLSRLFVCSITENPGLLKDARRERVYPSPLVHLTFRSMMVLLALFTLACMALGVYGAVVYALTLQPTGNSNLSMWLIVHACRTLILLPFCAACLAFGLCGRLRRQDPIVQLLLLLASLAALFAVAWLVVGTVWVFAQPTLRASTPLLYWSCLGVVVAEYLHAAFWGCLLSADALDAMARSDAAADEMLAHALAPRDAIDEFDTIP